MIIFEISMFCFAFGMFASIGWWVGEGIVNAVKDFWKGFKIPTAGPKLQKMIDEEDFPTIIMKGDDE